MAVTPEQVNAEFGRKNTGAKYEKLIDNKLMDGERYMFFRLESTEIKFRDTLKRYLELVYRTAGWHVDVKMNYTAGDYRDSASCSVSLTFKEI